MRRIICDGKDAKLFLYCFWTGKFLFSHVNKLMNQFNKIEMFWYVSVQTTANVEDKQKKKKL